MGVAEFREDAAHFLGHHHQVRLGVLRVAVVFLLVTRYPRRAVGDVATLAHDAANRHHQPLAEHELVGPEQGVLDHVGPGLDPATHTQLHGGAQPVHHQCLVRLGQAHLAGQSRVFLAAHHRSAGATVDAVDLDDIGPGLGHATGDGADVLHGHELDRDLHAGLRSLEVVDELCQILNRIDVVVRRRADEVRALLGEADLGNFLGHLLTHQLATLAGLGPLGHLDLQLVGIDQVLGIHTEPTTCHLANLAAEAALHDVAVQRVHALLGFALGQHLVPERDVMLGRHVVPPAELAAFAGVAAPAQFVHCRGDGHVAVATERTVAHGRPTEVILHQVNGWDHGVLADGVARLHDGEEVTQHGGWALGHHLAELGEAEFHDARNLVVDHHRRCGVRHLAAVVGDVGLGVRRQHRFAQGHAYLGVVGVVVAVAAQHLHVLGLLHPPLAILDQILKGQPTDAAGELAEVLHQLRAEAHGLEQHRPAIAFDGGDAHLADDLLQRIFEGFEQSFQGITRAERHILLRLDVLPGDPFLDDAQHQVRMHRIGPEADQHRHVVPFLDVAGLHDQAAPVTQALLAQVRVDRTEGQQAGDGVEPRLARFPIRDAQHMVALVDPILGLGPQFVEVGLECRRTALQREDGIDAFEGIEVVELQLLHHGIVHDGAGQFHLLHRQFVVPRGGQRLAMAQRTATEVGHQAHRPAFAVRVDGRVGHFRKGLLAVLEQRGVVRAEHREHAVVPHAAERFLLQLGHVLHEHGALEVPPCGLQQVVDAPVLFPQGVAHHVVGLAVEVEPFGLHDLLQVQLVDVAQFLLRFGDHPLQDLVAVGPLAGGGVQCDHLPRLELAAGHDVGIVQAEHAALAADVQPAPAIGAPAHRAQAHPIHHTQQRAAIGGHDAGRTVPRTQAAVGTAHIGKQLEGFRPPHVFLGVPHRRDAQSHRAFQAPALFQREELQPFVQAAAVAHLLRQQFAVGHGLVAGQTADVRRHRVAVGADRVDLAVVGGEAERLGQLPVRQRVRAVAAMEDGDACFNRLVREVGVEVTQLRTGEQALVADEAYAQAGHIHIEAAFRQGGLQLQPPAVQPALGLCRIAGDGEQ